jgi:2-methylcitrate dehydratase PrpD
MGRLAMLDWWGVTVGGVDEPVARLVREAGPEPPGPASVLGTDRTASPVAAAFWNATASHALDYDDITAEAVQDQTVRALAGRVRLFPQADLDESRARAVVRLRDGSVRDRVGDLRTGRDPERLRWELGEKFQSLTEPRLGRAEAARLRDALGRVDEIEDLRELTGPAWRRRS